MKMKRIWPKSWPSTPWVVLGFWAIITAAFTWPLLINLGNTLPDWGDGADSAWRLGSIAHQLQTDPLHLYNTQAFYPLNNALALDELLTGQGLLAAPLIWLTTNPPLAYNLLVFLSFTLSGFSMWLLVRHLTASSGAGLVAGVIFAFSPWHYGQYAHLGLGAQHWMIFALYFLIRFTQETGIAKPSIEKKASARKVLTLKGLFRLNSLIFLGLFVIFFALQAITAGYYAYYEAILVGFYLTYYFILETGLIHWLWGKISKKSQQVNYPLTDSKNIFCQIMLLLGAGILILGIILPFVIPFLQTQAQYSFKRDITETSYWSASPNSLLRTVDRSWLYNPVQRGLFNLQTSAERMLYPGLIAVLLALTGLYTSFFRKSFVNNEPASRRQLPWVFMLLSLSGLVLSFGPELNLEAYGLQPTGITLPYKWFYDYIPGFDALRVPLRFGQLFMLGIAVCAGYGAAWLSHNLKLINLPAKIWNRGPGTKVATKPFNSINLNLKKSLIITLLVVLVGADFFAPGLPNQLTNTGKAAPPLYRWLAGEEAARTIPDNALLLELPVGEGKTPVNVNPIYLMYGLSHGRPMLNGSANIIPPGYDRLYYEMQSFPAPATLDIIEGLGVKFVVVHTRGLAADANRAELEKQAGPGGRLEAVQSFTDPTDSRFKEAVYRITPAPQRFQALTALIPAGSSVLLADTNSHRRLYTYTLAALLGPNRRYFAPFSTVYSDVVEVQLAQPGQVFDYAIFYRSGGPNPTDYGFSPSDLIPLPAGDFDTIQLYHKK